MGKIGVKSSSVCLVLCYETITKGRLTVGKGFKREELVDNHIKAVFWGDLRRTCPHQ